MYHGPYSKGSTDSDQSAIAKAIREQLVPIFDEHDVDLVLSSQSKSYERSYLVKGHTGASSTFDESMIVDEGPNQYVKPLQAGKNQGTTYVVGGAVSKTIAADLDHPVMPVSLNTNGSVVLDIVDNRLEVQFIDVNGERIEQVEITKGDDQRQPKLMRGKVKSANRIALVFNEKLNDDIGGVTAYRVSGPNGEITVRNVTLADNQRVIYLTVDDLPKRQKLTVEVDGVADLAGNMAPGESTRVYSRFDSDYKPPVVPPKPPVKPPVEPPINPPPIVPKNTAPVAKNDSGRVKAGESVTIDVLANDRDADGDTLTIASTGKGKRGKATIEKGLFTYTANANADGRERISYTVSDGKGGTAQATVIITIEGTEPPPFDNKPPVAVNDTADTKAEEAVLIKVLNNDSDPDGDAKDFVDSGYKVKDLLVSMMSRELFRANGTTATLTEQESNALASVGFGRLLSPAEANAKAQAVTGAQLFADTHTGLGLTFGGFDGGEIITSGNTDLTPSTL